MLLKKKVCIGIDLTEVDAKLISYFLFLCQELNEYPELVLVHNIKYELDEDTIDELDVPLADFIQQEVSDKYASTFADYPSKWSVLVKQNNSTVEELLHLIEEEEIDLLLLGKKLVNDGSGAFASRMLRHQPCSILLIPDNAIHKLQGIYAPIDFSSTSARALRFGIDLKQAYNIELIAQHIYYVPEIYFPFIPIGPVSKELKKKSKNDFAAFLKKYKIDGDQINWELKEGKDNSVVLSIVQELKMLSGFLVIIGFKGDSSLFGSVALGLSQAETKKPIMFLKK